MSPSRADLRRKQLLGIALSALAMASVAVAAMQALAVFGAAVPAADDLAARIAFALRWLTAPGATLLIGIVVASRRGFHAEAIDGTRTPVNQGLEIGLRYNQNTLEQTVLAAIAWLALAVGVPHAAMAFIPMMAALFVVGRATFWIGYLVYPIARAYGMTLTVLPTLLAYAWLAGRGLGRW